MNRNQPQVVVVETGTRSGIKRADAVKIRKQLETDRQTRRRGRTINRLGRHLYPWWAALGLIVVGLATWAIAPLAGDQAAYVTAAVAGGLILFIGWMVGRGSRRWRHRLYVASWAAALWIGYTATVGPSWMPVLALVAITVVLSARWWKAIRIPHPKGPSLPEPKPN